MLVNQSPSAHAWTTRLANSLDLDKSNISLKEKNITHQLLLDALKKFNKKIEGTETQYIPHCTTWLNQRRWETVEEVNKQENNEKLFTGVTVEEFKSASRPRKRYYINNFGHQLTEYVNQGKLTLEEITYIWNLHFY